jgi:hypothetical protein
MNIAILVPVCSRNQSCTLVEETPFFKYLYPSFQKTKEDGYNYKFFIGYDDDDMFYIENSEAFPNSHKLMGCQNAPARAWNKLADIALADETKFDYFFQIGDDVILETAGWTSRFISRLQTNNNIGIVGPCNISNYNGRLLLGKPYVIENAFISRKHLEIFGYLFHPLIKNWYCDDWLTRIYDGVFCEIQVDFKCINSVMDRYDIDRWDTIEPLIDEGRKRLMSRRVFSYCLYGNQKKYCLGMVRNLEQIQTLFPYYQVFIYLGNDVPQEYIDRYKTFNNVTLIQKDFTGGRMMAYRYFILENDFDAIFVRDADSRFGDRDIWCINHFLKSTYKIFTIRDHYYQMRPLMGGQTGFKYIRIPTVLSDYETFKNNESNPDRYQNDQDFIEQYIFNRYRENTIAYSEFHYMGEKERAIIPIPRKSDEDFCGNVYLFDGEEEHVKFTLHGETKYSNLAC